MEGVTVIVPVWNGRDLLAQLLASLRAQTCRPAEILAIDNGSTDGAAEFAERHGARVIRLSANLGFSKAVNRGIRESRTEWLAIVNTDVALEPNWIEALRDAACHEDHPDHDERAAWFATGKLLNSSRRDVIDGTYDTICRGACAWRAGHGRRDGPEFSRKCSIDFAPLTAALFRAELFRRVGFLDEEFGSYLEDVDLGMRCASAGCSGVYVPEAIAYHRGSASLGKWHPEIVGRISRNQVLLVAKHYPPQLIWRFGWSILVAQGLWGVVAIRHGAGWAFLRGKVDGLRMFRAIRGCSSGTREILQRSEREIRGIQEIAGFDLYWKLYFFLTAGGAL
ncbi:MAG: glycosyltransferase family 2 protein [Acidobacteriota bacterium]|nr:glycosyltransferase family 2 protein [Acidobacteriota bacterium]